MSEEGTGADPGVDEDATVVASDATVVAPRPADDATVVAPRPADDATVVVVRPPGDATEGSAGSSGSLSEPARSAAIRRSGSFSDYMRGDATGAGTAPTGLDPERRIAPVPDRMPWETAPAAETGVHHGLPVVYGPRDTGDPEGLGNGGVDAVTRLLGPPPAPVPVTVREGRERLPALGRRERARRIGTLLAYGAVVVLCGLGLWAIARLVFA